MTSDQGRPDRLLLKETSLFDAGWRELRYREEKLLGMLTVKGHLEAEMPTWGSENLQVAA
jgi:hypothetical protein